MFQLDPNHVREFSPIRPVDIPFFEEMVESLGHLQKAGKQKSWIETPRQARLTLLFFFAPWCEVCHFVGPLVKRLHGEYEKQGLAILGVSEYGSPAQTEEYRRLHGHHFPFVYESMHADKREDGDLWHRRIFRALSDGRAWGTPTFVFWVPGEAAGIFACAGEFIEEDVERFLKERLRT